MFDGNEFLANAAPIPFVVGETTLYLTPKRFSTGSYGWFCSGKVVVDEIKVQATLSLIVVGSKPPEAGLAPVANGPVIDPGSLQTSAKPKKRVQYHPSLRKLVQELASAQNDVERAGIQKRLDWEQAQIEKGETPRMVP